MSDPVTPTVSPTVASTVGLKNVVIAPLTVDTESTLTYGTLQLVAGAIEANINPGTTDPEVQYADDIEFHVLYPDPEISVTMKMADIPLEIQAMLLGNTLDKNGVLVKASGDTPAYYALGFKSEKANGSYRYVWLFKCRAKPLQANYATKQGKTVNHQEPSIEFTAIRRTHDNYWEVDADEGENGFTTQMGATFLTSVYTPDFST